MPVIAKSWLRLPVVSAGAEYLVMGYLMRWNILAYKAPPNNAGYDLICVHPDPRHRAAPREASELRVQVKSRYATDCGRGFTVREHSLDAFDFLVVVFLNIGRFSGKYDGSVGEAEPEFYTLPRKFVQAHHEIVASWERVRLGGLSKVIKKYKNAAGFEQIARLLGIARPLKARAVVAVRHSAGPRTYRRRS